MRQFPIARRERLIVEELPDEVLVYDLNTNRAHCLNKTAALIWQNCDGRKSEIEIAELVGGELASPVSEQVIMLGLEELAGYDLLEGEPNRAANGSARAPVSRRQLIKNLGLTAAIALPLIISIPVPTAAQAATDPCIGNPRGIGCSCLADGDCDSGNCNAGTCGPELKPAKE